MKQFPEIKGKLGFGALRMPVDRSGNIDYELLNRMVDTYLANGFNYFDSAHAYMGEKCEEAIRKSLTERHPRSSFVLANKLTYAFFNTEEDVRPFFETQLSTCGVQYFDFYFMHAITRKRYEKFSRCKAFETALALKEEGKIRHFGISFHDKADFLEEILEKYPEIEVVQIQLNYADWDSPAIESGKVYEVCRKYNKPVFVMEPVKGGSLQRLPPDARVFFDRLNEKQNTQNSYAGYALRFAAGFEQVELVLSGMNAMDQLNDNISILGDNFKPLNEEELDAVEKTRNIFDSLQMIQCTACRYCVDECPKHILIPDLFACYNQKKVFNNWNQKYYYQNVLTIYNGKASDCLKCGRCEANCPQKLPIRDLLPLIADEFEISISDIKKTEKYYKYAYWATSKGYTYLGKGKEFNPSGNVRRIDLAVFMWRIAGRPRLKGTIPEIADIPENYKFIDAVVWALNQNILFLDKNRKFDPQKLCTRLDSLVYIWRKSGRPEPDDKTIYIRDYWQQSFTKVVQWAVGKNIAELDENNRFYPLEFVDRITVFKFLYDISPRTI